MDLDELPRVSSAMAKYAKGPRVFSTKTGYGGDTRVENKAPAKMGLGEHPRVGPATTGFDGDTRVFKTVPASDDLAVISYLRHLLETLKRGTKNEVRSLLGVEKELTRSALLVRGYDCGPTQRTPLMCAVARGNMDVFVSVMHAFNGLFSSAKHRALEMKKQLLTQDAQGWTVAMLAARTGQISILQAILEEIVRSGAPAALTATDHDKMTVLMHAAAAGNATCVQLVVRVIKWDFTEDQMDEYLLLVSADDRTLLMFAAQSSDPRTFHECAAVLRHTVNPRDFRISIRRVDNDGRNLLMHAVRGSSGSYSTRIADPAPAPTARDPPTGPISGDSVNVRPGADDAPTPPGEDVCKSENEPDENESDTSRKHNDVQEVKLDDAATPSLFGSSAPSRAQKSAHLALTTSTVAAEHQQPDTSSGYALDVRVVILNKVLDLITKSMSKTQFVATSGLNKLPQFTKDPQMLWFRQATCMARDMLGAKDSWGRTLASHAILSGIPQVFLASMSALAVLGSETLSEFVRSDEDRTQSQEMKALAQQQLLSLQNDIDYRRARLTWETQLNEWCPVKLLLIFHLILPEVNSKLALLIIMAALAPVLELVGALFTSTQQTSRKPFAARRSFLGWCLLGPVMFVWGGATSSIFVDEFDLSESGAALTLVLTSIIVPALDPGFGVFRWSCGLSGLYEKEDRRWMERKARDRATRNITSFLAPKFKGPFVRPASSTATEDANPVQLVHTSDIEAAMEPAKLFVAGDEWEVLAEELEAGSLYVSKEGGVRLQVQEGSLVGPVPDPINLHHSVQPLKAKGRDYITDTTVHCPPNVSFQDPLLLDFLLGDRAISGGKGVLQDVLQNYQVLSKNAGDTTWKPIEQDDVDLVDEAGATYLRARIYHFTIFCCGKVSNVYAGIESDPSNTDDHGFLISNPTKKTLFLVQVPFKFASETHSSHAATYEVGMNAEVAGTGAGANIRLGYESESRTVWVSYPNSEAPSRVVILPGAKKQMLYLRERSGSERLLLCTVEDEPSSSTATPTSPSGGARAVPPVGGANESPIQVLRFYGDPTIVGGGGFIFHQPVFDRRPLKFARVDTSTSALRDVAMALAGLLGDPPARQPSEKKTPKRRFGGSFGW